MLTYRLALMVVALAISAHTLRADSPDPSSLQGLWFGDVEPVNNKVLMFRDDEMVVITPLGGFKSRCVFRLVSGRIGEVDIARFDGKRQLGIFELSGAKLYLKLASPTKPRPSQSEVVFPDGTPHWNMVFTRRPTEEGLAVLQKYLEQF